MDRRVLGLAARKNLNRMIRGRVMTLCKLRGSSRDNIPVREVLAIRNNKGESTAFPLAGCGLSSIGSSNELN